MSRPSCLNCGRKHLGQASIHMDEAALGYPDHMWLAIAHMAEAESELRAEHYHMSLEIREHRKAYEVDGEYNVPIMDLIRKLTKLDEKKEVPST